MSTGTVDHLGDAVRAALAILPAHAAEEAACASLVPWVSSEYPIRSRGAQAGTQTPTHNTIPHHDGLPVVTNSPAPLAGGK